jgi:hypothetical protein
MSDARREPLRPKAPEEFQLWAQAELARIDRDDLDALPDQLHADAERHRKEKPTSALAATRRVWKVYAAMLGTSALVGSGAALAMIIIRLAR